LLARIWIHHYRLLDGRRVLMIAYIKGNTLSLKVGVSLDEFNRLAHLHAQGEIHVSLSVKAVEVERIGFIPISDLVLECPDQLSLEL
jgi:hypothetical protein